MSNRKQIIIKFMAVLALVAFCGHIAEHVHAIVEIAHGDFQLPAETASSEFTVTTSDATAFEVTAHSSDHEHEYKCCNLSHLFSSGSAIQLAVIESSFGEFSQKSRNITYPPGELFRYKDHFTSEIFHPPTA